MAENESTLVDKAGMAVGFGIAAASDAAGAIKRAFGAAVTTVNGVLETEPEKKAVTKKPAKKTPAKKAAKKTGAKKASPKKAAVKKTAAKKAANKAVKKARAQKAATSAEKPAKKAVRR